MTIRSAIILGAGIAGLACATTLARAGIAVSVLDKGRRPGGRVATRRADGSLFNHGAQFATARNPDFTALLADLNARPWLTPHRLSFIPGMSALPAAMADRATSLGAVFHPERHAAYLHHTNAHWTVRHLPAADIRPGAVTDSGGDLSPPADALLVALPSDQAATLLATAGHPFAQTAKTAVTAPCWAVMTRFPSPIPGPDTLENLAGPLAWAARENSRPGYPAGPDCWTLHATAAWSRSHLEDPPDAITQTLTAAFRSLTNAPPPDLLLAHRWRHALVETPIGMPCLWDPAARLGACGDWCLDGRIEAAYDSGISLAQSVLNTL